MERNDPSGHVEILDNRATLTFTRLLEHPPAAVWEAITSPEEFKSWYHAESAIDRRVGGLFEVFAGPFHWTGKILAWEPPRLFEYKHNHEPCKEMPSGADTLVRWELIPSGRGTTLKFTQSRLKSNYGFAPATHVFLDRLDAYLGAQPLPDYSKRFHEIESLYPRWKAEE